MFTKNKVFAYENSDGDKGIIIARSIDEAEKIFHKKYPERKIVDNYYDYCKNGAYWQPLKRKYARFLRSKDTNPNRFNECWAEYQAKNGIRLA